MSSGFDVAAVAVVAGLMGVVFWAQHRYVQVVERTAERELEGADPAARAKVERRIRIGRSILRTGWLLLAATLLYALWRGVGQ